MSLLCLYNKIYNRHACVERFASTREWTLPATEMSPPLQQVAMWALSPWQVISGGLMTSRGSSYNLVIGNHLQTIDTRIHVYVYLSVCSTMVNASICRYLSISRFLPQKRSFRHVRSVSVKGWSVYLFRLPGQLWSGASAAVSRCVCWNFLDQQTRNMYLWVWF